MQLARYKPWHELQRMGCDMDKLWENGWDLLPSFANTAIDLYEEDSNLVAEVSLPNFKKDEIKITTDEGMLEVSAEHEEKEEKEGKRRYYFRESSRRYFRRVGLPEGVNADKADASFKDGVLKITMPMAKAKKEGKVVSIK